MGTQSLRPCQEGTDSQVAGRIGKCPKEDKTPLCVKSYIYIYICTCICMCICICVNLKHIKILLAIGQCIKKITVKTRNAKPPLP